MFISVLKVVVLILVFWLAVLFRSYARHADDPVPEDELWAERGLFRI